MTENNTPDPVDETFKANVTILAEAVAEAYAKLGNAGSENVRLETAERIVLTALQCTQPFNGTGEADAATAARQAAEEIEGKGAGA